MGVNNFDFDIFSSLWKHDIVNQYAYTKEVFSQSENRKFFTIEAS